MDYLADYTVGGKLRILHYCKVSNAYTYSPVSLRLYDLCPYCERKLDKYEVAFFNMLGTELKNNEKVYSQFRKELC